MLHLSAGTTNGQGGSDAGITMTNKYDNPDNSWSIKPAIQGVSNTGLEIRDVTDNRSVMVFDGSGNVGIGTSSGANLLNIHQSDASSNSYLHITHADGGSGASNGLSIGLESNGVNAVIRNRENGYLRMYTNNTERMRIDASGNLLVGKTSTSVNTQGIQLGNNGRFYATSDGAESAVFNRKTSDGIVVDFRKDNTTVGNIMSRSGASSTIILDPRSNGSGLTGTSNAILPTNQVGTVTTNHVDLGDTNSRFRNLYLSGNVTAVGMSTFSDITIGKVTDGQALIQMIANPTNGANTIHFGDTTSGVDSYDGYINYAHDSRTMQFQVGGSESMRILRDDGTGDGAVKIKGGLGLHFSSSSDASQYMMGVGTDNSYRSGVIFELQTSQSLWACGFIKIKCAAGRNGLQSRSTAEYLYKFQAYNEAISGIGLVSSSGNTSDFTISVTEANANSSAGTVELKVKSTVSTDHGTSMTHVEVGHYNGINKLRRGI
jgi:hypothetical protein